MSYWKKGQIIQRGKYVIDKVLGAGGAGITYRAKDVQNNSIVAIKTLNATIQAQPNFSKHQERFIQEAFRLAKCSHSHVIRVDDVCQEGELWCMVMEYIDGGNLEHLVKNQGGLSEVEAIRYVYQVGSALDYIHKQGILHRDVKPANIMRRSQTNEAVLIDFGLARDFIADKTQIHTNSRTEGFAPLEQYLRNAKRGAYTDVYALAATLYYILTLQIPFPAQFRQQGINLIQPKQHNNNISARTNLAVLKGMELLPENRPQSVNEWLGMLTEEVEIQLSNAPSSLPTTCIDTNINSQKLENSPLPVTPVTPVGKKNRQPRTTFVARKKKQNTSNYDPLSPERFKHAPYIPPSISTPIQSVTEDNTKTEVASPEIPTTNPEKVIPPPLAPSLSEVGIEYDILDELLRNQKWYEADQETQRLMLKAVNKEMIGWIDRLAMKEFPCKDLSTIDQLWVKYSRGKFGISVQKRIYQSLGGKRTFDKKIWESTGDRIGWRENRTWLFQESLKYSIDAPLGHLPSIALSILLEGGIYTLVSRSMDCNIN